MLDSLERQRWVEYDVTSEQWRLREDTPRWTLAQFATDGDPDIRRHVAGRAELPEAAVRALVQDPMPLVRRELADNRSVPESELVGLWRDPHWAVRCSFAASSPRPAGSGSRP